MESHRETKCHLRKSCSKDVPLYGAGVRVVFFSLAMKTQMSKIINSVVAGNILDLYPCALGKTSSACLELGAKSIVTVHTNTIDCV